MQQKAERIGARKSKTMSKQTDNRTAKARADSLQRLVRRRESLLKQLKEVRDKLKAANALSGAPRPADGQRIRLYRGWGRDAARDEIGIYLEGVFYEKGSKRPYHIECKYIGVRYEGAHILCDDGSVAGFKIVKNRKDGHAGWRAV